MTDEWATRVEAVWADAALSDLERIAAIDALAAQRDADDPRALYERAGARDSAGMEEDAEPLYRAALRGPLAPDVRTQAVIQLASTLRNLGRVDEALGLLEAEYAHTEGTALHDAVAAFLALALVSAGESERAAAVALQALAPHLPRYTRSVTGYAREIADRRA
ncbi:MULTISPECIES: tetratricopeptide repeat protein [Microbacterium]|uniref:Tetratricopeptide repeat protein n=1 Tax=Microbacterium wangchenii TaxID=2541726 RepID=A0ABX5SVW4_9MICO|nr:MULTISPECIES: tetratricopeptide repeat protein [Microbacterium]MCK6065543.1 tetratricopeptide repeat protein [Microbacterium sp. EYE_512]QBR88969.1 tetratricopeptide repeat protein [Microbacterium wangchenii]TXK20690.1 tetratricopeptide repeat protein [Microbacterium wangchenii]